MKTILIDFDINNGFMWSAMFSFEPFSCTNFFFKKTGFDQLESALPVLREVMNWRVYNPRTKILLPMLIMNMEWTALFCNYSCDLEKEDMFSMCGPIDGWYLKPIDRNIILYLDTDDGLTERAAKHIKQIRLIEGRGIPYPDKWDWRRAATISYLFNVGEFSKEKKVNTANYIQF